MAQLGNLLIFDVRPRQERDRDGAIPGVSLAPYSETGHGRNDFISAVLIRTNYDKDRRIALMCSRGVLSRAAHYVLLDAGFQNVLSIRGGFLGDETDPGWKQWGLPVE